MSAFNEYHSVETLRKIAEKPVDLSKGGCLCPKRMEEMMMECLNLRLFYGTERVNEKTMETLFELANEAGVHEKMLAMQNGEVINKIVGLRAKIAWFFILQCAIFLIDKRRRAGATSCSSCLRRNGEVKELSRWNRKRRLYRHDSSGDWRIGARAQSYLSCFRSL